MGGTSTDAVDSAAAPEEKTPCAHKLVDLRPLVQKYPWGAVGQASFAGQLYKDAMDAEGAEANAKKFELGDSPYAELWIGMHPKGEAYVRTTNSKLSEFLQRYPEFSYGDPRKSDSVGVGRIPYLLKVLSIAKPLSIQVHPDLTRAAKFNKKDPTNYPDSNHKPEVAIVLEDGFEALHGMRPWDMLSRFIVEVPELASLLSQHTLTNLENINVGSVQGSIAQRNRAQNQHQHQQMRNSQNPMNMNYYQQLPPTPEAPVFPSARALEDAKCSVVHQVWADVLLSKDAIIVPILERIHMKAAQYTKLLPNDKAPLLQAYKLYLELYEHFPKDRGCLFAFLMCHVKLNAGDCLWIQPTVPHAYLKGNIVECMANSDNVVRAGLTNKYKDVVALLDLVRECGGGSNGGLEKLKAVTQTERVPKSEGGARCFVYEAPTYEFCVYVLVIPAKGSLEFKYHEHSSAMCLTLAGKGTISNGGCDRTKVSRGSVELLSMRGVLEASSESGSEMKDAAHILPSFETMKKAPEEAPLTLVVITVGDRKHF